MVKPNGMADNFNMEIGIRDKWRVGFHLLSLRGSSQLENTFTNHPSQSKNSSPIQAERIVMRKDKSLSFMKRTSISILILCACSAPVAWAKQQKAGKTLAGYTAIQVEPFTVEHGELTKDFPTGEEANLQLSAIAALQASGIFEKVLDGSQKPLGKPPTSEPSVKEERHEVILSSTIISFAKGDSGSRVMMWPLPVGVSKAKARFVFRRCHEQPGVVAFRERSQVPSYDERWDRHKRTADVSHQRRIGGCSGQRD